MLSPDLSSDLTCKFCLQNMLSFYYKCMTLLDVCLYVVKRYLSSFKLPFSLRVGLLRIVRTGWGLEGALIVMKMIYNQTVK